MWNRRRIFSSHGVAQGRRSRKISNINVCVKLDFFQKIKKRGSQVKTDDSSSVTIAKPCRFFLTERGCPKGSLCTLWVKKKEKKEIIINLYHVFFDFQVYMMNYSIRPLHQSKSRTSKKKIVAKITFLSLGVSSEVAFALVLLKRRIQTYHTLPPIFHDPPLQILKMTMTMTMMTLPLKSYIVNVRTLTHQFRVLTPCNSKWNMWVLFFFFFGAIQI